MYLPHNLSFTGPVLILERDQESIYVFTSQRAAWLRQQGRPDHLSERGIEHLWMQVKQKGTHEE